MPLRNPKALSGSRLRQAFAVSPLFQAVFAAPCPFSLHATNHIHCFGHMSSGNSALLKNIPLATKMVLKQMPTLSERMRASLSDTLYIKRISQRDAAERASRISGEEWSFSRVSKVLTGKVELRVDDAAVLAEAAGLTMVELTREPGREFVADLTPSELQLLEQLRAKSHLVPAILQLLGPPARVKPSRAMIKRRMESDKD